jgi:hypothetical protein
MGQLSGIWEAGTWNPNPATCPTFSGGLQAGGDVPRLVENGLVLIGLLGGNSATVKDLVFEGSA